MTPDACRVPRRVEGTETARLGAEQVVLDAPGRILRGLNPVGARVWELIDGVRTAEQIAHQLSRELEVDPSRALEDVTTFLNTLRDCALVRF